MIRNRLRGSLQRFVASFRTRATYDLMLATALRAMQADATNPLNKLTLGGFSQADEDSVTLEILRRIAITSGTFAEFGVGNGLENNTIALLALGWRGAWFGGEPLNVNIPDPSRLTFTRTWITTKNIVSLYQTADISADIISLDLDGNDYHFADTLLKANIRPKLFIIEYNAKFVPPCRFVMPYNDKHRWTLDDYFGSSLTSIAELFQQYQYRLVACSLNGANAFFVSNDYADRFDDVPMNIAQLYRPPFYFLPTRRMHPTSPQTITALMTGTA